MAFPLGYAAQGGDRLFVENNDPLAPRQGRVGLQTLA